MRCSYLGWVRRGGGYESLVIKGDLKDRESAQDRALNPVLRLHIGLEDVGALIEDLQRGFAAAQPNAASFDSTAATRM